MLLVESKSTTAEGFTLRVNVTTTHSRFVVSGDGHGIEGRAGASLLTAVADQIGLTEALRDAVDGCRS